jgi:hypothetical protein
MSGSDFPEESATSFYATTASAASGYYSNKATATSLSTNTEYVYRLGDGSGNWSENYYVTTYPEESFSFLAVGDPQIGASSTSSDTAGWADTLDTAMSQFPDVAFIVSAGDQVQTKNSESQFSGFFSPVELTNVPVAPALGNHDNGAYNTGYHFNLPNLSGDYGITSPGSADYYFTHGDALFVILNTNNTSGASHEAFISEAVSANPDAKWKIAMFHHDIYGSAFHALETSVMNLRAALFPIFDEYEFDVVISGHDHSYSRSHVLYEDVAQEDQTYDENGAIVNPTGTVYFTLNSASGSKYYSLNTSLADYCAFRSQIYVPTFSHVEIDGDTLTFDTYRTDTMAAIDTFSIVKTDEGTPDPPEGGFVLDTGAIASGGEYLIKAGSDDYILSISSNGSLSKTAVTVVDDTISLENDNAVWIVTENSDGYAIQNKGTGEYLTIESSGGWRKTYFLSLVESESAFNSTTSGDYKYFSISSGWWSTRYVSYNSGSFTVSRQSSDGAMLLYLNND